MSQTDKALKKLGYERGRESRNGITYRKDMGSYYRQLYIYREMGKPLRFSAIVDDFNKETHEFRGDGATEKELRLILRKIRELKRKYFFKRT